MNRKRATRLSLDLLRGFRSAARHLSFTRAAQDLFVTQSAISREIKTLEEQLGQPLFRRVNRTLQLTPAGEGLYRIADETLTQLDAEVERITGASKVVAVTTRGACIAVAGTSVTALQSRASWHRRAGGGEQRQTQSRARPARHCHSICVGGHRRSRQRTCFRLQDLSSLLAGAGERQAASIRTPADLAHHVRLDYESMRDGRRLSLWDFWFDKMKIPHVKPASTLQFPQYDQLVSAAIEGSGVGIAVLPHSPTFAPEQPCVPFGMEAVALLGVFYIIRRPDVAGREAVEAFVDWLWSEVRRDAELAPASVSARSGRRAPARKPRSISERRNAR